MAVTQKKERKKETWLGYCKNERIVAGHKKKEKKKQGKKEGAHEYELPTGDMLGAIVYEAGFETKIDYDIIIEQCIYDAIMRGDSDGSDCGGRLILPQSFIGGPRYMYAHYLDALAICRIHGNPSFFITFTCNVKWPEITEYMDDFPGLTTTDRADIVDHVFEMEIRQFVKYQRDAKPFGKIIAVLYTVEFQKRGLPYCHTLVWIDESSRVQMDEDIDAYISVKLPSKDIDPECYRIISEFMIHGPCGLVCLTAQFAANPYKKKTTLTEWLEYNERHTDGRHMMYLNFPSEFVWYKNYKYWQRRRQRNKSSIGRMSYVHPADGDLFYQRMLLCHQIGCRSFRIIRTVNDVVYPTCYAACEAMGLLEDDREWENALQEASLTATPAELRTHFAHMLTHCHISNPLALWKRIWKTMLEDIPYATSMSLNIPNLHIDASELEGYTLYELEACLNHCSKSLTDFGLPLPPEDLMSVLRNRLLMEEKSYNRDWKNNARCCILCIVSLLLPSGCTAHSRFKLPLDLNDTSVCSVKKNTQLATLLKETNLIIWDESLMNDRRCLEALDRTLRDILDAPTKLFGGKTVMLGGDFRQTLPEERH
ncbi:DNA helicase [Tanacetum coccineum]